MTIAEIRVRTRGSRPAKVPRLKSALPFMMKPWLFSRWLKITLCHTDEKLTGR